MSNSTRDHAPPAADGSPLRATLLSGPLAAAGFWTGIALPFLYVPLLLAGPSGVAEQQIAFVLIALHGVALLVGHNHRQDAAQED
ncbi:MAG: hypothetical protein ABEJ68_08485 [Halobacteriaceae archaeon]